MTPNTDASANDPIITTLRTALLKLDRAGISGPVKRGLHVLKSFASTVRILYGELEIAVPDLETEPGTADSGILSRDLAELFIAAGEAARTHKTSIVILVEEIQNLPIDEFGALILAIHHADQKQLPILVVGAGLPSLVKLSAETRSYAEHFGNRHLDPTDFGGFQFMGLNRILGTGTLHTNSLRFGDVGYMKLARSALLATAVLTVATVPSVATNAQATQEAQNLLALIQRVAVQYIMQSVRSFVELTYEQLTVEPGSNALIVSGLKLYPTLAWDQDGKCEISIDRAVTRSTYGFETISTGWELSGVSVSGACIEPETSGLLASFGYEDVNVDSASIEFTYTLPDSAAEFVIQAAVRDAIIVSLGAKFDYFWFKLPKDGNSDLYPAAQLGYAEIAIENRGLWGRLEPTLVARIGSVIAIPQMVERFIRQTLTNNGSRTPTEAEQAFVKNLSAGLSGFLKEKKLLVVTAAPEGGTWLDDTVFDSPQNLIAMLRPKVSNVPLAFHSIIPPADMNAALADGANPDDAIRMKIGKALLTGLGAPRSIDDGASLLLPLAESWSGEAAAMLAKAYESVGRDEEAYEMALIALASGDLSALAVADELEQRIPLVKILNMQDDVNNRWPGTTDFRAEFDAAVAVGDVGSIREHAAAASIGRGLPRSYSAAYMLATLAAAGGDRSAANLRDRLDHRFGGKMHWQSAAREAAAAALGIWINGGMGAAITNRIQ
ncbi:MAG: hypothetical protein OXF88_19790 [Rhodobacteraceae bacterium]|nr:hypothetical protein [Paracoccaceae bacterium]